MNCRTCLFSVSLLFVVTLVVPAPAQRELPPKLPANAAILTGDAARVLFKQCSRASPASITGYWVPSNSDVVALEAALPRFLAAQKLPHSARGRNLGKDLHQCAGFLRGGRKWIYVNGFTRRIANESQGVLLVSGPNKRKRFDWRRDSMDVCDGGASFWGVEYDVEKRTFAQLQFNGPY